jgi:hypothetical protein
MREPRGRAVNEGKSRYRELRGSVEKLTTANPQKPLRTHEKRHQTRIQKKNWRNNTRTPKKTPVATTDRGSI